MPKIVDHEERRQHIAVAATSIIKRDGFNGLTMRQVASEAGYAHGAITRYFPNKQSLLTAAFAQITQGANERIVEGVGAQRGLDALLAFCEAILPYLEEGRKSARVLIAFWDHASEDPDIHSINRQNNLRWRGLIKGYLSEAKADGVLSDELDIDTATDLISAHNAGWQLTAVLLPEATSAARIRESLTSLIDGLHR